jgi:hypothetical protein
MIAWEAPCNRGPQEKADHGDLCGTCNHTRWSGALTSSDRSGRYGVPAVRKSIGPRGLCPSHKVPWEGPRPRSPQAKPGTGARAEPVARPNRPVPLRAAAGREGRRPPPSARISGPGDCAPPTGSHGSDRILAVRKNVGHLGPSPFRAIATLPGAVRNRPGRYGPRPGCPLEGACNRLPVASRCTGHPAFAGTRGCGTLCRTPTAAIERAPCFARSLVAVLCVLCVSVVQSSMPSWWGDKGGNGRKLLWSQFFC